ncbi:MAG: hypothetical protein HC904_13995 [Blastochloris sp.]|nr:hypothetical protein [Blastochloris sp.]
MRFRVLFLLLCIPPFLSPRLPAADYSPSASWTGAEGNPLPVNGNPLWKAEQVYPPDPGKPENYILMIPGESGWRAAENTQGGQPSITFQKSVARLGLRSKTTPPGEFNKVAALSFISPEDGGYQLKSTLHLDRWEGGGKGSLVLYKREMTKPETPLTLISKTELPVKEDFPFNTEMVPLKKGDELVIVGVLDGYHSGANLNMKDLVIQRIEGSASAVVGVLYPAIAPIPAWKGEPGGILLPANTQIINVKERYGAVGDGQADDGPALQKAITEHLDQGGRTLYLPAGTYRLSSPLSFGDNPARARFLSLQGQGRDQTILKLVASAPGFSDPAKPRAVLTMLESGNKSIGTPEHLSLHDLTIEIGPGNPGAMALQWACQSGGICENVTLRAPETGDSGLAGLELNRLPSLSGFFKNLRVEGFDHAVLAGNKGGQLLFEQAHFQGQRKSVLLNQGSSLVLRKVQSENRVPFALNTGSSSSLFLHDAQLLGGSSPAAIQTENPRLMLRRVEQRGYTQLLEAKGSELRPASDASNLDYFGKLGSNVGAFPVQEPPRGLDLPVEETPQADQDPLDKSLVINIDRIKAEPGHSSAMQEAIDIAAQKGQRTLYLPSASGAETLTFNATLRIHGNIQRIHGLGGPFKLSPEMAKSEAPLFKINSGSGPVFLERMFFLPEINGTLRNPLVEMTSSRRDLVLKSILWPGPALRVAEGVNPGKLFLENVQFHSLRLPPTSSSLWARQLQIFSAPYTLQVEGAKLWLFGPLFSSDGSTWLNLNQKAQVELIGGMNTLSHRKGPAKADPLFLVNGLSQLSASYTEFSNNPSQKTLIQLRETRDGAPRLNTREAEVPEGFFPLLLSQPPASP